MNKMLIFLIVPIFSIGQTNLFRLSSETTTVLTNNINNTVNLELNEDLLNTITKNKPCLIDIYVPVLQNKVIKLKLEYFEAFSSQFQLSRTTKDKLIYEDYIPRIISYKITGENDLSGSISINNNKIIGVIKTSNKTYEISHLQSNQYALFDVSDALIQPKFNCQTITRKIQEQKNILTDKDTSNDGGLCINMAIEIDYYTYSQFNFNCYDAVDWALSILTGVSEVYSSELNVIIEASHINVWETNNDPYDGNDMYDYLDALENRWTSSWQLFSIDRDVVHLFTKREIGGGLANIDGLCSNWSGYAVVGGLSEIVDYDYLTLPFDYLFSWNFMVVAHELGHNIGSNHTHDCLWAPDPNYNFSGGHIDNCNMYGSLFDSEESCYGTPSGLTLNSSYEYGTIMSYCHVTGQADLNMEFHPIIISQALNPGLINSCLNNNCSDLIYDCGEPLLDVDGDGIPNIDDNCISEANVSQSDNDGDGYGNACDNCIQDFNISQSDSDGDGYGNACDNCYLIFNPEQIDTNNDGIGDACDENTHTNEYSSPLKIVETIDVLGRDAVKQRMQIVIYSDGSVQKMFQLK